MKYTRLHINHFGRLSGRTLEFSDGIHNIYSPNESGKTTMHAFLEAMLFGMERGRGRNARKDNYTRYYPETGGSTYGGVLEFIQDDTQYAVYRNFSRDPSGLILMDETHSRKITPTDEEYRKLIAGLTLPLYRNTVSLRQLQSATSDELPEQLRSHIVNLRSTGSGVLDLSAARERLKKERKELEHSILAESEARAARASEEAARLQEELDGMPIPSELSAVEEEQADLRNSLEQAENTREELLEDIRRLEEEVPEEHRRDSSLSLIPFLAAAVLCCGLSALLLWQQQTVWGAAALGAALLCAAAGLFAVSHSRRRQGEYRILWNELKEKRTQADAVTDELLSLRHRENEYSLRKDALSRQLWLREQKEEQLRHWEEERDSLQPDLDRNAAIREEIAAVRLASETIDRLSVTAFQSFGQYLQDTASELISQITGGRYSRLLMDDDLHITLEKDHVPTELAGLSCSTLDQVYLALRIACIGFFWPEESIPLLMDESFAMYDEERIKETLGWLAECYPGQVFLFTCQHREEEILAGAGIHYQFISL